MLPSEPMLCDVAYTDEASILSAMFAQPLELDQEPRDTRINIEMVSFLPYSNEHYGAHAEDVDDQSRLLETDLMDGTWSDVASDYHNKNTTLVSDKTIRYQTLPTIWYCVKKAFSMPSI